MTSENEHDEAAALAPTQSLFAGNAAVAPVSEPKEEEAVETVQAVEEVVTEAPEPTDAGDSEQTMEAVQTEHAAEDLTVAEATVAATEQPKTLKELQAEKAALDAKIAAQQKAERKAVVDQIAIVVKNYNIPVAELVEALGGLPNPRKGTKAPVLFTDGKNNWTGRGKIPNWLKDKNIEDYRIK
ncbi:H-NS histone family protein [Agrobacterium phage OLIVR2]|uniref:H-NS histone family protein n=1 Tax=Agrobacterium phage OLIVR1 TaxID=2723769 RepID=A0A858MR56_9CAUD|nr:H-NS histone family protein [Xanthomonas campestris]YP_010107103.1 H-NS histone family protein [Agrobacterium phage OLIVR1]QIW87372.1 H-NS histone family protein [Agrobacterium phage OLIVR2]QIW87479.1 H-NS histone family protein [Agrobacterium phage OLIVR3]MCF8861651.1 H-NS histone family protein [Xanthomonas campestris pv. campestris]QIW87264.1 H-NS histone family protein [Agrobacterium phage OLIVR1]